MICPARRGLGRRRLARGHRGVRAALRRSSSRTSRTASRCCARAHARPREGRRDAALRAGRGLDPRLNRRRRGRHRRAERDGDADRGRGPLRALAAAPVPRARRVGGEHASTCFLLADDPSAEAQERLSLVARNRDGFVLAQADLELRGPGELFGTRQAGAPSLRVASLLDVRLTRRHPPGGGGAARGRPGARSPAARRPAHARAARGGGAGRGGALTRCGYSPPARDACQARTAARARAPRS